MAVSSQVVTSQLPAAFETYYKEGAEGSKGLIPQAFQLYGQGTPQAFQAQYVDPLKAAGLYTVLIVLLDSHQRNNSLVKIGQLGTPAQFQMGTGALGSGYGAIGGGISSVLDPGLLQQYMSPYAQGVVDVAKREATRDAQKAQLGANLGAVRQGTYGGARQTLAQTERERALQQQLGDIQTRGLQSAFEAGQKGLEAERTAQLQRAQTLGQIGSQFGQLGVAQQAADIDRLKTLGAYGDLERALTQQGIDARFADVIRGMEFPEQQLDRLSGFIRGIPMGDRVETTTTPPPSFASQLSGMGIAGLGLYRELAKGG
jgi:hypothetical protein